VIQQESKIKHETPAFGGKGGAQGHSAAYGLASGHGMGNDLGGAGHGGASAGWGLPPTGQVMLVEAYAGGLADGSGDGDGGGQA
jgi:hypothetical protein